MYPVDEHVGGDRGPPRARVCHVSKIGGDQPRPQRVAR